MPDYLVTTWRGLEPQLIKELNTWGITDCREKPGEVFFSTQEDIAYRLLMYLRTGRRLFHIVHRFRWTQADQLYKQAQEVDWSLHMSTRTQFRCDALLFQAAIPNTQFAAQRFKDAVVDQFLEEQQTRPSVDRKNPDLRLVLLARNEQASLGIDLGHGALRRLDHWNHTLPQKQQWEAAAAVLFAHRRAHTKPTDVVEASGGSTDSVEASGMSTDLVEASDVSTTGVVEAPNSPADLVEAPDTSTGSTEVFHTSTDSIETSDANPIFSGSTLRFQLQEGWFLPAEAVMQEAHIAPGLLRQPRACTGWLGFSKTLWAEVCAEAEAQRQQSHPCSKIGVALRSVKAIDAFESLMRFLETPHQIQVTRASWHLNNTAPGQWLVETPVFEPNQLCAAVNHYARIGMNLRRAPQGTSLTLLSTQPHFAHRIGRAERRHKLFWAHQPQTMLVFDAAASAAVESTLAPGAVESTLASSAVESTFVPSAVEPTLVPNFAERIPASASNESTSLPESAEATSAPMLTEQEQLPYQDTLWQDLEGATMFANRCLKKQRKLASWKAKNKITCYRLYDADLPEYNVAVDVYEDIETAIVQEYKAPKTIEQRKSEQRLHEILLVLPDVLSLPPESIVFRQREPQKGKQQYQKHEPSTPQKQRNKYDAKQPNKRDAKRDRQDASRSRQEPDRQEQEVRENRLFFLINVDDYLDTGLFLDHRTVREWIRDESEGKDFLNLFCYTGSASV
ncbi:MAG: class I SAM-dependent methyltransferase, partial [Myxococcota bacterium]